MDLSLGPWSRWRRLVVDLFVLANIAFLALDIYIAHSVNNFANPLEWVPFVFSVAATPVLALAIVAEWRFDRGSGRRLGLLTGCAAIVVGIGGMILHHVCCDDLVRHQAARGKQMSVREVAAFCWRAACDLSGS